MIDLGQPYLEQQQQNSTYALHAVAGAGHHLPTYHSI